MRKCAITVMAVSVLAWAAGCASVRSTATDKQTEKKIDELLAKMTLEEKVGQMTQVTLEVVAGETDENGSLKLDNKKLQDAIVKHQVGSILNCGGQARSVDNWHEIITQIQTMAMEQTRLGIPIIYGIDAIHGANYTLGATIFPQHIAMAATGNVDLIRKEGEITALEVRASGMPWNFNPVLGLGRNPMWS
ncbi:MAG: glycoside hydrolase family 3 N-terminal domain-containing protein, partial [Planctomycetota bacterium]